VARARRSRPSGTLRQEVIGEEYNVARPGTESIPVIR
jgi:hypothetical protein